MVVWVLGMFVYGAILIAKIGKLRRWHREQLERESIPDWFHDLFVRTARRLGIERLPAIVFSDQTVTPAVYGLFSPVLLLPANYIEDLSEEDRALRLEVEVSCLEQLGDPDGARKAQEDELR